MSATLDAQLFAQYFTGCPGEASMGVPEPPQGFQQFRVEWMPACVRARLPQRVPVPSCMRCRWLQPWCSMLGLRLTEGGHGAGKGRLGGARGWGWGAGVLGRAVGSACCRGWQLLYCSGQQGLLMVIIIITARHPPWLLCSEGSAQKCTPLAAPLHLPTTQTPPPPANGHSCRHCQAGPPSWGTCLPLDGPP